MIKVLIVDDSASARYALRKILERDADIVVVGEAADSIAAMSMVHRFEPHFITMDIYLGHENGLDLTKRIMVEHPRPILVVTGVNPNDPQLAYRAIEQGALDLFPKPPGPNHPDYARQSAQLIRLVKTLSKVPVLHQRRSKSAYPANCTEQLAVPVQKRAAQSAPVEMVLMGASTGGPPIICEILQQIPKPVSVPIVVVQHISKGFSRGLAEWLGQSTGLQTVIVEQSTRLEKGTVYIAADDGNLVFSSTNTVKPQTDSDTRGPRPNIDQMFNTAAARCRATIVAYLMTGMGSDGAAGLARLRQAGAITVAQEPETCAVDSMPTSAIQAGAAQLTLAPEQMVAYLALKLNPRTGR